MGSDDTENLSFSFSAFLCWWHSQKDCLYMVVKKATNSSRILSLLAISTSEGELLFHGCFSRKPAGAMCSPLELGNRASPILPEQTGSEGRRKKTAPTA